MMVRFHRSARLGLQRFNEAPMPLLFTMNKTRRIDIASAVKLIEQLAKEMPNHMDVMALTDELEDAESQVRDIHEEECDAFNSMPEGLQQSERGMASEEATQFLEEAADSIADAIVALNAPDIGMAGKSIDMAIGYLESAIDC